MGHADIKTTQVYTRVSIRALKDIHTATHPAKLARSVNKPSLDESGSTVKASDLLGALDDEADLG